MGNWDACSAILIIRADNMGDVLMSSPAIRAVRNRFKAKITLLTSKSGAEVARLLPEIDEVLEFDVPWVKNELTASSSLFDLATLLKNGNYDGCIIFTVYSQNPLPAALLASIANIPLRLAYCRENPYGLLTDWVPDPEPLTLIRHQVERDLHLVSCIDAYPVSKNLFLSIKKETAIRTAEKLRGIGIGPSQEYLILHSGVSEQKRHFPKSAWISSAKKLIEEIKLPLVFTGTEEERGLLDKLIVEIGAGAYSAGGLFTLEEFAAAVKNANAVISVNTGTVHLAAAVQTPIVVLYAQTNPQHHPWMVPNIVLEYSIPAALKSKNQLICFVDQQLYAVHEPIPDSNTIVNAVANLLTTNQPRLAPADHLD
jgi:ADP-heptose:LPS heptosyltransferase